MVRIPSTIACAPGPGRGRLLLAAALLCLAAPAAQAAHDGDINSDSKIDVADLLWGIQALTGQRVLTVPEQQRGDVAPLAGGYSVPDGDFDLGDVTVLYRVIAGELVLAFAGVPANQFNIGDSIGVGEAAGTGIGNPRLRSVWSTGYEAGDEVNSLNERLEVLSPALYYENDATRDAIFNHAVSGAVMADFNSQATAVVAASASVPGGEAGKVAILLGANDVCADSEAAMTDPATFESQYRIGLDALAASPATSKARIDVLSIPPIYWLWNAKHTSFTCRIIWAFGNVCQSLLSSANEPCVSDASRLDPDNDYGDAPDSACQRRKRVHRAIRDDYNAALQSVLQEYIDSGDLPNARYTDLYDIQFESTHVNNDDCFHPSLAGHALLADSSWCRSPLGIQDAACNP
jgi:lysophospholipase L1-like esterase